MKHKVFLIVMLLVVMLASPVRAALTYGQTYYRTNFRTLGSLSSNDPLYNFIGEVDNIIGGSVGYASLYFTPGTQPSSDVTGTMYYNAIDNLLYFYNDSSWVPIEANTGGLSLDGSYNLGKTVTVDDGTITFAAYSTSNNAALTLTQADATNNPKNLVLTNAGSGNTIDIQGTSGNDIQGTGDVWGVTTAGAATFVGVATTGDVTVTGAAADITFDVSDDELMFQDDAVLTFGDTADATVSYDGSGNDLNITSTTALDEIAFGATGDGYDLVWHSTTAGDYAIFDYSADAILLEDLTLALGDGESILFGDTLGTGDFSITDSSDVLVINNVADGTGTASFGVADTGLDVAFYGDAGSGVMTWDENQNTNGALVFNNADIEMGDADFIQFGDTTDATLVWNATLLKMDAVTVTAGTAIQIETTDGGIHLNADGAANGDLILDAGDIMTLTAVTDKIFDGAAAETWIIEGTADEHEATVVFTDATADITWTFPTGATDTLAVMGSTLATNVPETVNSVTGGTNQLIFEGTADAFETILTAEDATADATITFADDSGDNVYVAEAGSATKDGTNAALPLTDAVVLGTSTAASAWSLADGQEGQILSVVIVTDGGVATITPATSSGWATAVLTDDIDQISMLYVDDSVGWIVLGTSSDGTNIVEITQ